MIMERRNVELAEALIDNKESDESNNSSNSKIDKEWLVNLFVQDNISYNISNREVQKIGGYAGLEEALKTSIQNGIASTNADKKERIRKYGRNDPPIGRSKTFWNMIMWNFEDRTIQILLFAALTSLILGVVIRGWTDGWLQGTSILLAIVIMIIVSAGKEYMKEKQLTILENVELSKDVTVIRKGSICQINTFDLLVGDLVQVEIGQYLHVDGIVVETNHLIVDQSFITGQVEGIAKQPFEVGLNKNCFLVSGTRVMEGRCVMMVLTVGKNTQQNIQKILVQSCQNEETTPLQQKLAVFTDKISKIGLYLACLTFIALFIHLLIDTLFKSKHQQFMGFLNDLVRCFIIAVSIIVIAVPEGLPLAVTISLAYSVGLMAKEKILVRNFSACETMGCVNNICTDKTGTLTKNVMNVTSLWCQGTLINNFEQHDKHLSESFKFLIASGIALNSNSNPKIKHDGFQQAGNKTECALLEMIYNFGFDYREIRKNDQVISTAPFTSDRKCMSAICNLRQSGKLYLFCQGQPENVFQKCSHYLNKQNQVVSINYDLQTQFQEVIKIFRRQSLRTLLICYKQLANQDITNTLDTASLEKDLIILGLAGIKDPLKIQVNQAVIDCKKAGIIVRMVTGDNIETATAIAKEANIISSDYVRPQNGEPGYYIVMEGRQFRSLVEGLARSNEGEVVKNIQIFKNISEELRVLARCTPQDKYILTTGLQQLGNIVTMTGDGCGDAPALKRADVGFAMGISGTQVAMQASDIVLLDDSFSSIVKAVKYGRNIFDCIRKFLHFQLTVNIVATFITFLGVVITNQSPITPINILWVNLVMDTFAVLALVTEPPSKSLLNCVPYSHSEKIITPQMWRGISTNSIYQIIVLTIILFKGDDIFDVKSSLGLTIDQWNDDNGQHLTIFFNIFVFLQVFNLINARKFKKDQLNVFLNFFNNYHFLIVLLVIVILQIMVVQIGGRVFMLVPLSLQQYAWCMICGSTVLVSSYLAKRFIPQRLYNKFKFFREEIIQPFDTDQIFERYRNKRARELKDPQQSTQKERQQKQY